MKIFGIGLSRTGTLSLSRALEILGYQTCHYPLEILSYDSGNPALKLGRFESYDAFVDFPVPLFYQELDRLCPGSKFILTVRDMRSWLRSCAHLFRKPFDEKKRPLWWTDHHNGFWDESNVEKINRLRRDVYGTIVFDEKKFRETYERHIKVIEVDFLSRPRDLLVLNICGGDDWVPLCRFLEKPVPQIPFPRENVTGKNKKVSFLDRFKYRLKGM
ncbi:MAG: hypothetical protein JW893_05655 [Candidatus Omnitrophica bacterium]|nr:hypothetical protein [Candidatus Omnitrophota bacterium]